MAAKTLHNYLKLYPSLQFLTVREFWLFIRKIK